MSELAQIKSGSATLLRAVLGVIVGVVLWMVGFLALARVLVMLWPAYAVPARIWSRTGAYTFTTPMSAFNVSFWILAEIAAGWLTAVIARRAGAVWALAVLVMGYLCFMHLYYAWHELPWWYNLIVAFSSGPAVLLGGRLGRGSDRTLEPASRGAS
jgi:hypothetical protein